MNGWDRNNEMEGFVLCRHPNNGNLWWLWWIIWQSRSAIKSEAIHKQRQQLFQHVATSPQGKHEMEHQTMDNKIETKLSCKWNQQQESSRYSATKLQKPQTDDDTREPKRPQSTPTLTLLRFRSGCTWSRAIWKRIKESGISLDYDEAAAAAAGGEETSSSGHAKCKQLIKMHPVQGKLNNQTRLRKQTRTDQDGLNEIM